MTYAFITWLDRSREKATMSFRLPDIAADGSNYAAIKTAFDAIYAAVDDVTDGNIFEYGIVAERTRITNVTPGTGRREQKWLVRYQDDVTLAVHRCEIPLNDESTMPMMVGTDFVDTSSSDTETVALLAALNTYMLSPAGNAITVISIEDVGRNK